MVMSRRFVPEYLFSFVVGFAFGEMMDVWQPFVDLLPQTLPLQVLYFAASYVIISFGIALANRSQLPITPTDLFPPWWLPSPWARASPWPGSCTTNTLSFALS